MRRSVVSAGSLRRTHTAVLVHVNVHVFALHLAYRRVRDGGERYTLSSDHKRRSSVQSEVSGDFRSSSADVKDRQ